MKITQLIKLAILLFAFSGLIACAAGSKREEPPAVVADTGDSDADAAGRQARDEADAAAERAAAAEERMRRSALSTRVFYFDFDVAQFRPGDRETLTHRAQDLAANPGKRIRLEGHADERGTREYNLALGERRTNSVLNYLIINGAARNQIETVSYGEERPADRGAGEAAYQRNRRVEIINQ